jgi:hypothetical protein
MLRAKDEELGWRPHTFETERAYEHKMSGLYAASSFHVVWA